MSINPYEPPQTPLEPEIPPSESDPRIVRDGKELVIPIDARPPSRCAKCNRPASHWISAYAYPLASEPVSLRMTAIVIIFSVLSFVFICTIQTDELVPEPLRKYSGLLVMVPSLAVIVLVSLFSRRNMSFCRFGICPFHNKARYASHAFYVILMGYFALNLVRLDLDNLPWWLDWQSPFDFFWLAFPAILAVSFVQINLSMKKDGENYRVTGCGKAFLESFPDDT